MGSLRREKDRGRIGWRLQFMDNRSERRVLWIGNVSKRAAETVARHVNELVRARRAGVAAEIESAKWANELTGRLRERLAEWGLVGAERKVQLTDAARLCGPYFDHYVQSRTDLKEVTRTKYDQSAKCFTKYAGRDRSLSDVTPIDIDNWRRWMIDKSAGGLAVATANKHAKRIKKMFADAVRAKLIGENPVADQKIGSEVNRQRDYYIDHLTSAKLLRKLTSDGETQWALIFGLCRYAGFRCPTEVLSLTWSDVDWEASRLRVDSVKTGLRFCPIFPALLPLLEAAYEAASDGTVHCVSRYQGLSTNLRSQMHRHLMAAGIAPWPKTFVNLRASCRTDLQDQFPDHLVNTWLGHSSRIAERHYLQTTDAHWERAANATTLFGEPHDLTCI